MTKLFIFLMLYVSASTCFAQIELTKRYEFRGEQPVRFRFDDATVVGVTGWSEDYISIIADVQINNNRNNDTYQIEAVEENGIKQITGFIRDKSKIPRIIRIKKGDEVFTFNTDNWDNPEIQQFYLDHGREGIEWTSYGIFWEIYLQINVPRQANVHIGSKHGIIELENISGQVEANSVHGGIDLTIDMDMKGLLNAKTKWGTIYSNVNLKIDKELSSDREWNNVIARVNGGNGSSIKLQSKHANIYLRNK